MIIPYDPTRESLYKPHLRPTIFVAPVNSVTSGVCAELSRLVYLPFEKNQSDLIRLTRDLNTGGFELLRVFNNQGTQAMLIVHKSTQQYVLAFRGTELTWRDFYVDALLFKTDWPTGGKVHSGFAKALAAIWPEIEASIKEVSSIIFTGHSLGAALATLTASKLSNKCNQLVTIGSPSVGNTAFVIAVQAALQGKIRRFVDCCDLVTQVPPRFLGFRHLGSEEYIDKDGNLAVQNVKDKFLGKKIYQQLYASLPGNVKTRVLADHSPINYIRAL
jgi:Lipase (class 3)